jgi:RNase P/RNase MRP subunit p29
VQEELHHVDAVLRQVLLEVVDLREALLPDVSRVADARRQLLVFEPFRVDARGEHFLVVRAVEDADLPALGQVSDETPEVIVLEFRRARLLVDRHHATLRVNARHDVFDRAVLARAVHRLKDE